MSKPRRALIEECPSDLSPLQLFEYFREEAFCFFLDSAMDAQNLGRFSLMGASPFLLFKSVSDQIQVIQNGERSNFRGNPFEELGKLLARYKLEDRDSSLPCPGGAVGYFGYDLCHFIEQLPSRASDDLHLPECYFGFYDIMLIYDNLMERTFLVSTGFPALDETERFSRARQRLDEVKARLSADHKPPKPQPEIGKVSSPELKANFNHEGYLKAIDRAREYIIEGDIFEVNLSQRFEVELGIPPFELYRRLREINPAPFSAYLDFDELTIVSASPERFLKLTGDRVETRPIKGTIRRGKTPSEDRANAQQLLASAKDHAENMMIVDLERNDLGRVCRFGSIKVTELAVLETFPTVFHLTSTVVGQLREGANCMDLLKATFPGGSITGAPKVRSMEIIDELEPTRRSVYTGSLGYLGFDGNLDLNIVIRTFLIKGQRAYFQAGGAVVYDSNPEVEYRETLDKVSALIRALGNEGL
jgi:para-aminobenzoate synthetase component I